MPEISPSHQRPQNEPVSVELAHGPEEQLALTLEAIAPQEEHQDNSGGDRLEAPLSDASAPKHVFYAMGNPRRTITISAARGRWDVVAERAPRRMFGLPIGLSSRRIFEVGAKSGSPTEWADNIVTGVPDVSLRADPRKNANMILDALRRSSPNPPESVAARQAGRIAIR